ncbi:SDR family oxidoreductase [Burkholderia sp. L27(2015)]|uniref:SDR family oxidoreductase n=1 Tax=Burkholderia sp. L27(2015) TaxID=1641858 RepID=UPI00131D3354|nr:SDR family oxidoreductase [Burkholderia sp. L27(2015)]
MSILLIGATGRTGRLVAEKLHAAAIPFCPLIRNAAKRDEFERLGARPIIADLAGDFSNAFVGMRTVIYAAGSAETEGAEQERLIDRDALIKSVDYAKQHGAAHFVVISVLLAYQPERSPQALRHYTQMKRESDDYVMASGLDYLVLRPGTLTMEPGVGSIQIMSDVESSRAPVAREDVADVVLAALKAGMANKVIGFAGGSVPIDDALATL